MAALANERVLIIGDSITVGSFGSRLERRFKDEGATVKRDAKSGRATTWFYADAGKLDAGRLPGLAAFNPTTVIIALGTNDAGMFTTNVERAKRFFGKVIADLRDNAAAPPTFWWVTAPAFDSRAKNVDASWIDAQIRAVSPLFDNVIDARALTSDMTAKSDGRTSDLIHFTTNGGARYADRVFDAFMQKRGKTPDVAPPKLPSKVEPMTVGLFVAAALIAYAVWVSRRRG
jgi:lysophospholipase L1-like esterase